MATYRVNEDMSLERTEDGGVCVRALYRTEIDGAPMVGGIQITVTAEEWRAAVAAMDTKEGK